MLQKLANFFNPFSLPDKKYLKKIFGKEKIVMADVGATGGLEHRWRNIEEFCETLLFDPDPRAKMAKGKNERVFPIGLWSKPCSLPLHLTKFAPASSLFSPNFEKLSPFCNAESHLETGVTEIALDSLDHILKREKIALDVIKIDTEGADLEILKGGQKALETSCFAVQIEVSFFPRNQGAPFFDEVNRYLRKEGFEIMSLYRAHWGRKNKSATIGSQMQLIWGDAVYVLSIEKFLERLAHLESQKRESALLKYLVTLYIYRFHDFAADLIENVKEKKLLPPPFLEELDSWRKKALPSKVGFFSKTLSSLLLFSLATLLLFPFKKWKKKALFFVHSQAKLFLSSTLQFIFRNPCEGGFLDHLEW